MYVSCFVPWYAPKFTVISILIIIGMCLMCLTTCCYIHVQYFYTYMMLLCIVKFVYMYVGLLKVFVVKCSSVQISYTRCEQRVLDPICFGEAH